MLVVPIFSLLVLTTVNKSLPNTPPHPPQTQFTTIIPTIIPHQPPTKQKATTPKTTNISPMHPPQTLSSKSAVVFRFIFRKISESFPLWQIQELATTKKYPGATQRQYGFFTKSYHQDIIKDTSLQLSWSLMPVILYDEPVKVANTFKLCSKG